MSRKIKPRIRWPCRLSASFWRTWPSALERCSKGPFCWCTLWFRWRGFTLTKARPIYRKRKEIQRKQKEIQRKQKFRAKLNVFLPSCRLSPSDRVKPSGAARDRAGTASYLIKRSAAVAFLRADGDILKMYLKKISSVKLARRGLVFGFLLRFSHDSCYTLLCLSYDINST